LKNSEEEFNRFEEKGLYPSEEKKEQEEGLKN